MYNALFESIIRTSGENTDYLSDLEDRDNFWAESPVIEQMFEQVLREANNQIDPNNLPNITIEVNNYENQLINEIQNSKTENERNKKLEDFKSQYRNFFTQNYTNKSVINNTSKVQVELVNTGIDHCLRQNNNYYLWPAIRYLPSIIEMAFHTTETSQHINDPNTTRGNIVHIFYCKGEYIFKSGTNVTNKTHILRISAITFKQGLQNNFRHITENNEDITEAILISVEIQ